jgi:hypothetical protein
LQLRVVRAAGPGEDPALVLPRGTVRRLHAGMLAAGSYQFVWDGKTDTGEQAPLGFYCAYLKVDGAGSYRDVLRVETIPFEGGTFTCPFD